MGLDICIYRVKKPAPFENRVFGREELLDQGYCLVAQANDYGELIQDLLPYTREVLVKTAYLNMEAVQKDYGLSERAYTCEWHGDGSLGLFDPDSEGGRHITLTPGEINEKYTVYVNEKTAVFVREKVAYQKALERGYDAEGERYHWLYNELLCRVQRLREALLYMEALPHFLSGADEDHALQYIMGYTSRLFRPENIDSCERDENQEHPFFRDSNPYWRELQEAMDAFNDPEILSNRPLLYVYACELITRAHRLYLQIREVQFRSIDREKFHALMLMPQNTYMGSAS